ncbi:YkuS family protein [Paenibacillus sp. sptzw28]|uniref:YkuS family protein n=1 Tax=Paenibacillus sp. sptzw28 TaxID=715179 RepID=UPI001C6EA4A7|nr:YkuS family protein [Paenibacillus sp. sptzw28]QYR21909.1 YkuS family protein [Paenibacillus sp. sptzw28]
MRKIAVENSLSHWKDSLQQNGYDVVDLDTTQQTYVPDVLCYVITGQDKDVMGMADLQADLPVINAEGITEAELLEQIKQRTDMVLSARG